MSFNTYNRNGQATVLRGFARQIDKLAKPELGTVRKLAEDVGLVVMTKEQYSELRLQLVEVQSELAKLVDHNKDITGSYSNVLEQVKFILVSHDEDALKLIKITGLLIRNKEDATV